MWLWHFERFFLWRFPFFLPALTVVDVAGHTLRVEQVAPTGWKENSYYWNQANKKIASDDDPFTYGCILGSCNILRHIGHRTRPRIEACKGTVKTKSGYFGFKCCCFSNVKMFFLVLNNIPYEIISCSSAVPSDPSATQTGNPFSSSLMRVSYKYYYMLRLTW